MKNFEQICCGQPIEGMKGRPDGCIVDINDSGVSVCVLMNRPTPKEISCIFRKNRALAPHERSAVPLGTDHCPVG